MIKHYCSNSVLYISVRFVYITVAILTLTNILFCQRFTRIKLPCIPVFRLKLSLPSSRAESIYIAVKRLHLPTSLHRETVTRKPQHNLHQGGKFKFRTFDMLGNFYTNVVTLNYMIKICPFCLVFVHVECGVNVR